MLPLTAPEVGCDAVTNRQAPTTLDVKVGGMAAQAMFLTVLDVRVILYLWMPVPNSPSTAASPRSDSCA